MTKENSKNFLTEEQKKWLRHCTPEEFLNRYQDPDSPFYKSPVIDTKTETDSDDFQQLCAKIREALN
jgi:hypothetical protein